MSEQEHQLWVTDSELEAKARLGQVMLFGGCPYKITRVEPVTQHRWAILGVAEPIHPEPGDWKQAPLAPRQPAREPGGDSSSVRAD